MNVGECMICGEWSEVEDYEGELVCPECLRKLRLDEPEDDRPWDWIDRAEAVAEARWERENNR